mmetsp:Transcript_5859/g.14138  ORF Transcript_5859/g.14138 Transcript_5859/m.14138 type:complete len:294 (-) Transcript_5859:566-1447(-)
MCGDLWFSLFLFLGCLRIEYLGIFIRVTTRRIERRRIECDCIIFICWRIALFALSPVGANLATFFRVNHRGCWYTIRLDIVLVVTAPTWIDLFQIINVQVQNLSPCLAGVFFFPVKIAIAIPKDSRVVHGRPPQHAAAQIGRHIPSGGWRDTRAIRIVAQLTGNRVLVCYVIPNNRFCFSPKHDSLRCFKSRNPTIDPKVALREFLAESVYNRIVERRNNPILSWIQSLEMDLPCVHIKSLTTSILKALYEDAYELKVFVIVNANAELDGDGGILTIFLESFYKLASPIRLLH